MILILVSGILLGSSARWLVVEKGRVSGPVVETSVARPARVPSEVVPHPAVVKPIEEIVVIKDGGAPVIAPAGLAVEAVPQKRGVSEPQVPLNSQAAPLFLGPAELEPNAGGSEETAQETLDASVTVNEGEVSRKEKVVPPNEKRGPEVTPGVARQESPVTKPEHELKALPETIEFSEEDLKKIGRRIWQSECAGTVEGLTSWNEGEAFASLGIGHFLWFPEGSDAIFDESFRTLLDFVVARGRGAEIPDWIRHGGDPKEWPPCPWADRREFLAEFNGQRMEELRSYLEGSVSLQAEFLVARFRSAFPKVLTEAGAGAEAVEKRFGELSRSPEGAFAMIDYVNFKGEGTKKEERYAGEGWGLLQVLQNMDPDQSAGELPVVEFSRAADRVLTKRTKNNAPDSRWLPGWRNRVAGYKEPF